MLLYLIKEGLVTNLENLRCLRQPRRRYLQVHLVCCLGAATTNQLLSFQGELEICQVYKLLNYHMREISTRK